MSELDCMMCWTCGMLQPCVCEASWVKDARQSKKLKDRNKHFRPEFRVDHPSEIRRLNLK
jgi:hypothetical protein